MSVGTNNSFVFVFVFVFVFAQRNLNSLQTEDWGETRWRLLGQIILLPAAAVRPLPTSPSLPSFMSLHPLHKSFIAFFRAGGLGGRVGKSVKNSTGKYLGPKK